MSVKYLTRMGSLHPSPAMMPHAILYAILYGEYRALTNQNIALLDQAITQIQAGDLQTGRRLLARLLIREPYNVDAWLWLSTAVDDLEQRVECLKYALAISPHNKLAWQRLAALTSENPRRDRPSVTGYTSVEFQCPKCGGERHFHIKRQGLVCTQCGYFEPIEQSPGPAPASEHETPLHVMLSSRQAQVDLGGTLTVTCEHCGSTTTWSARHGTVDCPFCGTNMVLHASRDKLVILPQALIPFQVDEDRARVAVHEWWEKGWARPPSLPKHAAIVRLQGVYIPFWTFDNLYRVQWSDTDGDVPGFHQPTTHEHLELYDDVLICGSYTIPTQIARELEPFDTKKLILYQPQYLAGWPAEVSQLSLADASLQARERMVHETEARFPTGAKISEVSPEFMTYKHILLPIWVGEYRYRGRSYHFAVNGQTGKVAGEAPRSLALLFDLFVAVGILIPFAALALVLFGPWPQQRYSIVAGAFILWAAILLIYFAALAFGWREIDVQRKLRETFENIRDKSLSPQNQKATTEMVDRLSD